MNPNQEPPVPGKPNTPDRGQVFAGAGIQTAPTKQSPVHAAVAVRPSELPVRPEAGITLGQPEAAKPPSPWPESVQRFTGDLPTNEGLVSPTEVNNIREPDLDVVYVKALVDTNGRVAKGLRHLPSTADITSSQGPVTELLFRDPNGNLEAVAQYRGPLNAPILHSVTIANTIDNQYPEQGIAQITDTMQPDGKVLRSVSYGPGWRVQKPQEWPPKT